MVYGQPRRHSGAKGGIDVIISLREWLNRVLFIGLFVVLLIIAAGGYKWLVDVFAPVHPYREPAGNAVKVFVTDPAVPDEGSGADQLRWFFWYGG